MAQSDAKFSVGLLFDDTLDSNDGVAQQVKRLGEYLDGHGHRVVYLCGQTELKEYAGGKVYSLARNIKVKFNGNRLSMPIFSSRRRIKNVLRKENLDIVHVTAPYSPFLAQRVIALADGSGIPIVGSFHILPSGWLSSFGSRLLGLLQTHSLKRFAAFTSTSKSAAQFAKQTMHINSTVVPNMIDLAKFAPGRTEPKVPGRIVFLGRLVQRKGCAQLIQAFARLVASEPSAHLVIAGDGPDRSRLEDLAKRLGVADRVEFLGFIDEADKPKILGSAQVACFPALYGESFGVVLIEAMAAGSGVVLAGNNPGYASVLGDQPSLLVEPTDTDEFADRLRLLLSDTDLAGKMHAWQSKDVKQYDINVVGAQMLGIYRQVIAKKQASRHN